MSVLGNILWFIFGGFLLGLLYILIGLQYCITIIGIPFGYQLMKIGIYVMSPFGYSIEFYKGEPGCLSMAFNILWIFYGWLELALLHIIIGCILCITVIGIPFGIQHFKIAKLTFLPFGQKAVK